MGADHGGAEQQGPGPDGQQGHRRRTVELHHDRVAGVAQRRLTVPGPVHDLGRGRRHEPPGGQHPDHRGELAQPRPLAPGGGRRGGHEPVPITEANQLGPRLAKASAGRSRSWSGPVRPDGSGRAGPAGEYWSGQDWRVRPDGGARAHDTSVRPRRPVPLAGPSLSTHRPGLCPLTTQPCGPVYGGGVPLSPHVPDLAALELFAAVARYGSIGAAARHTGVSQQAASARLRAMEAQVGAALLDRDPRGSRLTPAGALLVDWAAPLLAQAGGLDSGIASLRRARDAQLRVAASLTVAEHLLPAWLVALRDEYARAGRQPAEVTLVAANSEAVAGTVAERRGSRFVEGPSRPRGCGPGGGHRPARHRGPPGPSVGPPPVPGPPGRTGGRALVEREAGSGTRQALRAALIASSARALRWPRPRCG